MIKTPKTYGQRKGIGSTLLIAFVLLFGALAIIPNGIDPRIQRPVNFSLCMMLAAGFYIFKSLDIFLGMLIVYACFISWQHVFIDPQLYYTIFGLIIFYMYVSYFALNREIIYDALIAIAGLNLLYQILQISGVNFIVHVKNGTLPGLMSNINETSALFAITAPAFFRRKRIWLFPIVIAGLILAHSRQGVVALAIAAAVWAILNLDRRYILAALAGIFITVILFSVLVKPFGTDKMRLSMWRTTARVAMIKPFTGWGFGQYKVVMPLLTAKKKLSPEAYAILYQGIADKHAFHQTDLKISDDEQQSEVFIEAHNEYVEWLFIAGITGLILLLAFQLNAVRDAFRLQDKIPLYGIAASSIVAFFGFSWHILPLALIIVLYLALAKNERMIEGRT